MPGEVMLAAAGAIAVLMLATWLASLLLRDASIVDPVWPLGFVVVAWVVRAIADGLPVPGDAQAMGPWFPVISLVTVFALQGVLMWIVSLPVQLGQVPGDPGLGVLAVLGVLVWGVGFAFETIASHARRDRAESERAGTNGATLWTSTRSETSRTPSWSTRSAARAKPRWRTVARSTSCDPSPAG